MQEAAEEDNVNQSTTVSTTKSGDNWSSDKLISGAGAASFTARRGAERTPGFYSSTRLSDGPPPEPLVIEGPASQACLTDATRKGNDEVLQP